MGGRGGAASALQDNSNLRPIRKKERSTINHVQRPVDVYEFIMIFEIDSSYSLQR